MAAKNPTLKQASSTDTEPESGGLDLSFVKPPPDDLVCSICLSVHREPVLTSCCGNHFCFSCVEQVRLERRPCPLCNAPVFTTMLDKYFVRKVNELEVACRYKDRGCGWQGSISALEKHANPKIGDCEFMHVECPHLCGTVLPYLDLDGHQKVCPRRPYACKFCGYEGVYEDMSAKHWRVCEKYPLPCPSKCGEMDIERCMLEKHLEEDCSVHKKKCEFAYAGCDQVLSKAEMSAHMDSSMQHHLSLLSRHCLTLTKSLSSEFHQKMEEEMKSNGSKLKSLQAKLKESEDETSVLRTKLTMLEEEVDDLKTDSLQLRSVVFVPPCEFIMTDFRNYQVNQQQWYSPAFYTHFGGYRMCIGVDASGSEEGHGTHVSVYINMMKGEYDQYLKWPFKGSISIELCNQRAPKGNLEETVVFTYDASEIASRVTGGDIAEHGLGIPTFIEQAKLGLHTKNIDAKKNVEIQYLKNDCLRFRVVKVDLLMSRRNTGLKSLQN